MSKKYVYLFSEGNASMKNLLGGKGCKPGRHDGLGLPVPQGFTVTTEACTRYYEDGQKYRRRYSEADRCRDDRAKDQRQEVRRHQQPLPGIRAFRCPRLHAGHDGHDTEPRPERCGCGRPCKAHKQRALCL